MMPLSILQIPLLASNAARIVDQFEDMNRQVAPAKLHNAVVFVSSGTGEIWHQPIGNLARNGLTLDGDVIYAHAGDVLASQTDPAAAAAAINDLRAQFRDRSAEPSPPIPSASSFMRSPTTSAISCGHWRCPGQRSRGR